MRPLVATAAAVIALALAGCAQPADHNPLIRVGFTPVPPTFAPLNDAAAQAPTTTVATVTTLATPSGTVAPAPASTSPAGALGLAIAPERSASTYDRALFGHWVDADHDGCDTRCEVLEAERRTDLPGLSVGWESLYDGYTTDDPHELDIDHVVSLGEAWRSGADTWDPARREAFANDLDEPDALMAVTAATNRSKSDSDPAAWQPPNHSGWCRWARAVVIVKRKWSLTVDPAEATALTNILAGCSPRP